MSIYQNVDKSAVDIGGLYCISLSIPDMIGFWYIEGIVSLFMSRRSNSGRLYYISSKHIVIFLSKMNKNSISLYR